MKEPGMKQRKSFNLSGLRTFYHKCHAGSPVARLEDKDCSYEVSDDHR